jgi:hypothetical protein
MDLLTLHATNTAWITWGMKCCGSRIKDLELAFMSRALSSRNIFRIIRIIMEQLSEQEVSDEAL